MYLFIQKQVELGFCLEIMNLAYNHDAVQYQQKIKVNLWKIRGVLPNQNIRLHAIVYSFIDYITYPLKGADIIHVSWF